MFDFTIQKAVLMFLAIAALQIGGKILSERAGARLGAGLSGFLCGFISSTAVVTHAARSTRPDLRPGPALLTYHAANLAMLIEAAILVWVGIDGDSFLPYAVIFLGPACITIGSLVIEASEEGARAEANLRGIRLSLASMLRLTLLIVALIAISRLAVRWISPDSVYAITLVASFFEVHAVTISNVGQFASGMFDERQLAYLIAISLAASYAAKWALARSLGGERFRRAVTKWTIQVLAALLASIWIQARMTSS